MPRSEPLVIIVNTRFPLGKSVRNYFQLVNSSREFEMIFATRVSDLHLHCIQMAAETKKIIGKYLFMLYYSAISLLSVVL